MDRQRFNRLARLVGGASLLLLAFAVLSQARLRTVRAEIDALASETSALVSENEQLRTEVTSLEASRQSLRHDGTAVHLEGNDIGSARAVVYLDHDEKRALLVVEDLKVDASCAYQLRIVRDESPDLVILFGVDPEGNTEMLLDDLPKGVREFRIEPGDSEQPVLSGRR